MAPRARLVAHLLLAGGSEVGLLIVRPDLDRSVLVRGDELGAATAWCIALATSVWLGVTTAACLAAVTCARPALARRTARYARPAVRRLVEVTIASSCVALPALPASAAPMPSPSPYSVFVRDEPVVRTPATAPAARRDVRPTEPAPAPQPAVPPVTRLPASSATTSPEVTPLEREPVDRAEPHRGGADIGRPRPVPARAYVVQSGDNLWRIARVTLADAEVRRTDRDVARYWRAVIDANRSTLRSGDPSLIYPGEIVSLPPVK
jgi:hypothetical protein